MKSDSRFNFASNSYLLPFYTLMLIILPFLLYGGVKYLFIYSSADSYQKNDIMVKNENMDNQPSDFSSGIFPRKSNQGSQKTASAPALSIKHEEVNNLPYIKDIPAVKNIVREYSIIGFEGDEGVDYPDDNIFEIESKSIENITI